MTQDLEGFRSLLFFGYLTSHACLAICETRNAPLANDCMIPLLSNKWFPIENLCILRFSHTTLFHFGKGIEVEPTNLQDLLLLSFQRAANDLALEKENIHLHNVAIWIRSIKLRRRIYPNQPRRLDPQANFLADLAPARIGNRLAQLLRAAWESPQLTVAAFLQ